jgi:predicted phosphate transport protein (TIGR00153 family)
MVTLFKKTKILEIKMDEFLDVTSESGLMFLEGVKHYLNEDKKAFKTNIEKITTLESRADKLRREIEAQLYTETLIPESRGDVLALLENTDDIINIVKDTVIEFSVEHPDVPKEFHRGFIHLAKHSANAVDEVVKATRAFLRNPMAVRNYLHKVYHYEKEADKAAKELKKQVFQSDLGLSSKLHLRYFVFHIDSIADQAEDVADRLAIYTMKRSV